MLDWKSLNKLSEALNTVMFSITWRFKRTGSYRTSFQKARISEHQGSMNAAAVKHPFLENQTTWVTGWKMNNCCLWLANPHHVKAYPRPELKISFIIAFSTNQSDLETNLSYKLKLNDSTLTRRQEITVVPCSVVSVGKMSLQNIFCKLLGEISNEDTLFTLLLLLIKHLISEV